MESSIIYRFVKWINDEKVCRREESRKLQDGWTSLINERKNIEEQKKNLEAREAKYYEIRDLIPLAKKLQTLGFDFDKGLVFIECVTQKAQNEQ